MTRRRWTLIVTSHRSSRGVSLTCSHRVLVLAGVVAAAAAASALVTGFLVLTRTVELAHGRGLDREHRALAGEVARLGRHAQLLTDSLAALSRQNDEMRLVAGLDPLSPDVKRGGIGGPSLPWPERDRLLTDGGPLGRAAFRVRVDLDALTRQAAILAASTGEAERTLAAHLRQLAAAPTIMPTQGFISSRFTEDRLHPILHEELPHEGVDIGAPYGARVLAPAAGRVVEVGRDEWNGLMVVLDHGYGLTTRYLHLSRAATVVGTMVKRGDLLGFVGSTGLSTGPHLHYEVRIDGRAVNPLSYILPDGFSD